MEKNKRNWVEHKYKTDKDIVEVSGNLLDL
jgi:hypothetical protein